jgi:predicted metalloprotease with PDZ domain
MRRVKVDAAGFGLYEAADYDELVDHPLELGTSGAAVRRARRAAPIRGGRRAARSSTASGCWPTRAASARRRSRFWHGTGKPPRAEERYVFMLNTVDDGYGGLEHRNSTALICRAAQPAAVGETETSDNYTTLLGLISHEYFHTWNVKRLRPAEFARYDYTQENYTQLLWFFEGFTSYYDDLLLRRCGLIDDAALPEAAGQDHQPGGATPGRQVQSVAQASFDAWVKYYRQDENTPNATISYYTKGSLVALCAGPDAAPRRQHARRGDARAVGACCACR